MVRAAALITALLLASPAFAADQFDLVCVVSEPADVKNMTSRYRVDLASGEWCMDKCAGTQKIAGLTSTRITFFAGRSLGHYTDRITGAWVYASRGRVARGQCTLAPFTGFGAEKVKF